MHHLRKPLPDGRTELVLTPVELLARLAVVISPPHLHTHCNGGVLAPRAKLHRAVVESAGPAGAKAGINHRDIQERHQRCDEGRPVDQGAARKQWCTGIPADAPLSK